MNNSTRLKLSIAIPASIVSDIPHPREKSLRIGLIGRAAAIFCVDEIVVFPDLPRVNQKKDANFIATILSYMETPQYLRKRLFKIMPELRYAGILPPLRTPHHPLSSRISELTVGEYREGVVVSSVKDGSLIDIGVERQILIHAALPINTRVLTRILAVGKHPKVVLARREEIKTYWGYRTTISKDPFGKFLEKRRFNLIIATSRLGTPIRRLIGEIAECWKKSHTTLIAFGSPTQGLYKIAAHEHLQLDEVADYIINTVPHQGTETVRTEEAVYASLAILKLFTS